MFNEALKSLANIDCVDYQAQDPENLFEKDKSLFNDP